MARPRQVSRIVAAVAALTILLPSQPASAHAFGLRYDLPLPLWLFLAGAGVVVVLSFVGMALLSTGRASHHRLVLSLPAGPAGTFVAALRIGAVAMLVLVFCAASLGNEDTFSNLAPTAVWIVWWLGLAYLCALFGDVWALINPFDSLFRWGAALLPRACLPGRRAWPAWLGRWPAALALLAFAWVEMLSEFGETPRGLAWLIGVYALATWLGMAVFGRRTWLARADVFAVFFGLIGRFGIVEGRLGAGPWPAPRRAALRWPGLGLVERRIPCRGQFAVVIVMLASVSFDGFRETPAWQAILDAVATDMNLRPFLLWLRDGGVNLLTFIETVGLIVTPLLFAVAFLLCAGCMRACVGPQRHGTMAFAAAFAASLVPIAIAYHLAHYLSYFLLAGQLFVPLLSDPFGWGWNLLGVPTSGIDVSVVNARMVWYVAVVAVSLGHVAGVMVAHLTAGHILSDHRHVRRSQIPMLVLMVAYTMTSLWILAQPVIVTGTELD
jgi:hypothetical protein